MSIFTSSRERYLWRWVAAVLVAILVTLFFGRPLTDLFTNQNIQAIIFMLGMLLVGTAILVHALRTKPGKTEIAIFIGIIAVYLMLFLRLGLPERSHLIEYSVLAVFIHMALSERAKQVDNMPSPALLAFVLTFLVGVLDECIQIFLPHRVFDLQDIAFNGIAAALAIGSVVVIRWVQGRFRTAG